MGLALLFVLQMFLMRRRHSIQESIVFVRTIDDNLDAKEISKSDLETGQLTCENVVLVMSDVITFVSSCLFSCSKLFRQLERCGNKFKNFTRSFLDLDCVPF